MKKKIVFMLSTMNVGGTEKSLLNLISELSREKYDISIYLLLEHGGYLNDIPNDVNVRFFKGFKELKRRLNYPPKETIIKMFKEGEIIGSLKLLILHIILKLTKDRRIFFKYLLKKYPVLDEHYDIAVAYAGPMDFISYFVAKKIRANRKFQWVHFDVTKVGFDKRFVSRIYNEYDRICVVSKEGKVKLETMLPALKEKVTFFPHIISSEVIRSQLDKGKGFNDEFDGIRILTVGRLAIEKGQDIGIRVLAKLIECGYNAKWYCVGDGESRKYYEKLIREYNLDDKFILLGTDKNPYPYIEQCDVYVQPSRHEGYCITLAEARLLRKPIVTTDFTGAKEQIINGETGLIVGVDDREIYNGVKKLLSENKLRQEFSSNLGKKTFHKDFDINNFFGYVDDGNSPSIIEKNKRSALKYVK
ncbi:glycosyltransferase [Virgibacillus sp. C22-A2]|uniref:Glycosyltransferase n=1 Tax=Virgibacillus tibetensis TaxID=3042313 RepID=A0ABU6KHY8_9BACI|nr:glycosyltransferase [Virgibacillus sp. C22-A2]